MFRVTQVVYGNRGKYDLRWILDVFEWSFSEGFMAGVAYVSLYKPSFGLPVTDFNDGCILIALRALGIFWYIIFLFGLGHRNGSFT